MQLAGEPLTFFERRFAAGFCEKTCVLHNNCRLLGGAGRDTMKGCGGDDWYYFGEGWGSDTISDVQASANAL